MAIHYNQTAEIINKEATFTFGGDRRGRFTIFHNGNFLQSSEIISRVVRTIHLYKV